MSGYKDLRVWQRAVEFVSTTYALVRLLPDCERFALADQIRRAVVSVPANIAEGQARQHRKEFLQALFVARGSLAEVDTLMVVAQRLGYLQAEAVAAFDAERAEVLRLLHALIVSLRRPHPRGGPGVSESDVMSNQQPSAPET
ncbi:MAG: four helix bundle protein [Thermoanaerobaculaceae bacterium]